MNTRWFLVLALAVGSGARAQNLKPFEFKAPDSPQTLTCEFPNLALPAEAVVFAAGAYGGQKTEFQIDQSGHESTRIDVAVNYESKPVVLMLGAYEPTVWNIGWSPKTRIVAVLASGYHRQALAGLPKGTPTLISTYDNRGACGYFYVSNETLGSLNPKARTLFARPVQTVYPAVNGKVVVGEPLAAGVQLVTSADTPPESYVDRAAPIAGPAGLEDAVRKGLLRRATPADAEAWSNAVAENTRDADVPPVAGQGKPKPPKPPLYRTYVVLQPFTYPAGLYGGNSAVFLIPKGVAVPQGNPGHSAIYDFNTLACQGPLCASQ